MGQFFKELKRRSVFRVAIAYGIVGWVLVQVTALAVPAFSMPGWVDTVVFYFVLIGFPVALVFAWAFELTPEGIKREEEVDRETSVTGQTGQKLNYVIGGALVLALGFIAWDKLGTPSAPGPSEALIAAADKSIAVLPFVSMSSGEDDGYFADGLTEELLNSLAQINDLKVAGRTSSFYYKGKTPNFHEVGEALGVAHILEGSVRRSGDTIRITAQLIRADNGFHLWSDTFDRASSDIFAIQDEIAAEVTAALRVTLLGEEAEALTAHGTTNAEAQSLYLIAIAKLRESDTFGTGGTFRVGFFAPARRALERAVELDPDYAEAWAALSRAYLALKVFVTTADGEGMTYGESNRLADEAADRALALAPDMPEAIFAKGRAMWKRNSSASDVAQAVSLMDRAMELAPDDVDFLREMARLITVTYKDYEGAIALYDRALAVDPLSTLRLDRANVMRLAGRAAEARAEYFRVAALYPDTPWKAGIAHLELNRGHLHHYLLWDAENPGQSSRTTYAWASLGDVEKGLEILRGLGAGGGAVGASIDYGAYYLERDYQGLAERMENGAEWREVLSVGSYLGTYQRFKLYFASYQRDWPTATATMDKMWLDRPLEKETSFGTPEARGHLRLRPPGFQRYIAFVLGSTAYALQMVGRVEEAATVRDWALDITEFESTKTLLWRQEMLVARARIHAAFGNTDLALSELEAAYEAGWRHLMGGRAAASSYGDFGWFEDNPMLDSIRDEPRFIAVINAIKADNARMLAELNAGLTLEDIMDEEFEDFVPDTEASDQ